MKLFTARSGTVAKVRPEGRWFRPRYSLTTLFIVVTVVATFAGWVSWQWRIVRERMEVADWIDQRNRDVQFTEFSGVRFFSQSPGGTGLIRDYFGDKLAVWVYVEPPITEEERERIVRAFPEAKQFLHVKESPTSDDLGDH